MSARKLGLLTALVLGVASVGWAGSCQSGSLASFLAPGYSCSEGSLTFSNFSYTGTASNTSPVSASQITVTPTGSSLLLQGPWSVSAGQAIDSTITYTVSGNGAVLTGVDISMLGFNTIEGGQVSVSASGMGDGTLLALLYYAESGGLSTSSSTGFDPLQWLQITQTISLTGNNGQSDLSYVDDQWVPAPTTPEPASMLLLGSGLLGLALYWRRRRSSARLR